MAKVGIAPSRTISGARKEELKGYIPGADVLQTLTPVSSGATSLQSGSGQLPCRPFFALDFILDMKRRTFMAAPSALALGAAAGLPLSAVAAPSIINAETRLLPRHGGGPRIVICGGGWGGLTAARYLRQWIPKAEGNKVIELPDSGGVSPLDADARFRRQEALYGEGWYRAITDDIWGA